MCPTRKNTKIRESWFGTSNAFERLVGGFNPSKKYWSKRIISPTRGEKKKTTLRSQPSPYHACMVYLPKFGWCTVDASNADRSQIYRQDISSLSWPGFTAPPAIPTRQQTRVHDLGIHQKSRHKKEMSLFFWGGMSIILKLPDCCVGGGDDHHDKIW